VKPYYDDGRIQIWHGDCRDVMPALPEPSLVIADPPYGFGQARQGRAKRARDDTGRNGGVDTIDVRDGVYRGTWRGWSDMRGDDEPFDPSHLLGYPRLVLFGANHYASRLPDSGSWLVWDKRNGATPDNNADAELIWTNLGGPVRTYRQCWRGFTRERDRLEMTEKHLHPTQKPVLLMQWLLDTHTTPDDLVIDPYMGCGPVPRAAMNIGRRAIGIEIEERYCEIAAKRLQQSVLPLLTLDR
jgi:site-specific DNA-methyltransferase (adenine-specific)